MYWKMPQEPRFTQLFVEDQMARNAEMGKKPQAFDTPFRFSDSGKCGRAMAYSMLGYEGEPFDAAGTFVTGLGTLLHEIVQDAILKRYPDAKFEVPSKTATSSGHADAIIPTDDLGLVLWELKTMNGTAAKKAIGFNTKGTGSPQGPRFSTIAQSALNAQANGCETIVVGHVALEAISKGLAEKWDIPEFMRFIAEWVIPKEVWEPIADAETARQLQILDTVDSGRLPLRIALDDNGLEQDLDPDNPRYWQCQYCSFSDRCKQDGWGEPAIKKGN
jgi:hypothetical protein